ncbi:MAG TPA: tetratricopeptide repeat protein [Kofleriaceae bacterium]|nr:tetratricopeptide repeat protein [Kofleriaceae bacterium]
MSRGSDRRPTPARRGLAIWAAIAISALAAGAAAQPSGQAAAATAQFDRGRAMMKENNYAEACAAFERSQKLDPQWGTLYNLAVCYAASDRLASAWAAYRELAQRDTNPARRKESAKQAKQLESRLPRLTLTAPNAPPGLAITLDGVDVTALIGTESPIDLGRHTIHASAPGYADFDRARTVVDEAKRVKLAIELVPLGRGERPRPTDVDPAPAPAAPAAPAEPAERGDRTDAPAAAHADSSAEPAAAPDESPGGSDRAAEPAHGSRRRTYGILVAAGGGALLASGLVFGQLASSKWDDARARCGGDLTCDDPGDLAAGSQLVAEARSRATISTVLVIGGVAAVGIGAALVLTAPRGDPAASTALRLTPAAGPGAVSVRLEGRF